MLLYGLAGSGKTASARALTDDERIKSVFRDGIAWLDGSRDPEEEVTRLCLALHLERAPGERWLECWRRWAGAVERRFLLIIDDATTAEELPPLLGGLGPQVVALVTTQQGAEIKAEAERWLPVDQVLEIGSHGLAPAEGRALVEAVQARPLADADWAMVREIGELVGWHAEALRLAALEGRDAGWAGQLEELRAGRLPWPTLRRRLLGQWAELSAEQRDWLAALDAGREPDAGADSDVARRWRVEAAIARRQLRLLAWRGLVQQAGDPPRWRVAPAMQLASRGRGSDDTG